MKNKMIFVFFATTLNAINSMAETNNYATGYCSHIINNNKGIINITCQDKNIEKKLQVEINEKIAPLLKINNDLVVSINFINDRITSSKNASLANKKEITNLKDNAESLKKQLKSLNETIYKNFHEIKNSIIENNNANNSNSDQIKEFLYEVQLETQTITRETESKIASTNDRINLLDIRFNLLESDVREIMQKLYDGTLDEAKIFFGLSLLKINSDDDSNHSARLEFEVMSKNIKNIIGAPSSAYIAYGKTSLIKSKAYPTLQGAQEIQVDDNNSYRELRLGFRLFFNIKSNVQLSIDPYIFLAKTEKFNQYPSYGLSTSIEIASPKNRTAIGIELNRIKISSSEFSFNPTGNPSTFATIKNQHLLSLFIRESFR